MKCAAAHFRYLHLSQRHLHAAINPLDQIEIRAYGEKPPTEGQET
jgi:hypothetical protein